MQTLNFTPKLLRQRRFFRFLLPLFALFVGLGSTQATLAQSASFYDDAVTFSQKPTGAAGATTAGYYGVRSAGDTPYDTYSTPLGTSSTNPATASPPLGTYDINAGGTSQLIFTGGSIVVGPPASIKNNVITILGTLQGGRLQYRSYLIGATLVPDYSALTFGPGIASNGATQYSANTNIDLTTGLLSGGNYVFEVRFEVDVKSNSTGTVTTYVDPSSSYTASFKVTSPPVTPAGGTTTWVSQSSTDWTVASNWSNGVPNSLSDAIIPEKSPNPAINTVTPVLNSQDSTLYNVRSLTLNGSTNSARALLRIGSTTGGLPTGATLNVYGDLTVFSGGILAPTAAVPGASRKARNSTIVLQGNNQRITGVLDIADLIVAGTGVKSVVNTVNITNTLVFAPANISGPNAGALMETITVNTDGSTSLNTTKSVSVQLYGSIVSLLSSKSSETNDSYILGVTIAQRNVFLSGKTEFFGNIGLDITPSVSSNATTAITRTVGDPLFSPTFPGRAPNPIARQYGVSGDINNSPNINTIVFHYLNSPKELNGNNDETQLVIFKATNNGPPYNLVGGTVDVLNKTVTKTGITAINTITLGSKNNPLPVTLTAFDAKRENANALLTWQTASELNSKGYNVEVSTDGKEYRTLSFIASVAPNSMHVVNYSYTDTEKDKKGVRYYRIVQIDVDGKTSYYSPRAVSFEGKVVDIPMAAYPNPFNGNDELHIALQSATVGKGQLTITDMTGRTIQSKTVDVATGITDFVVNNMADLKSGLYLVKFMLPSGEVKNLKVMKQ